MKRPTLADARELGLLPSVTTLLKVLAKPALQDWLIAQAVRAVMDTPRLEGETNDQFVERVLVTERIQDREAAGAADLGSSIHDALEEAVGGRPYDAKWRPYVFPVLDAIQGMGKVVKSEFILVGNGYAGRSDILIENERELIVGDFKTTRSVPPKEPWIEARLQTAAYAKCLGNVADKHILTAVIYISTVNIGEVKVFMNENWPEIYEKGFLPILNFWRWSNSYSP